MRGQKHCVVFAMLVGLGTLVPGSAAWAGGGYNYEQDGGNWGGSKIGPLGQCFACGTRYYRGYGGYRGFALVPSYRHYRHHRYYRGLY